MPFIHTTPPPPPGGEGGESPASGSGEMRIFGAESHQPGRHIWRRCNDHDRLVREVVEYGGDLNVIIWHVSILSVVLSVIRCTSSILLLN